ncbi:hypothetical protein HHI36_012951 [Cryptolaemus montrouzieri]|uniref:RING-type E3 ubiquitin transferase n=1 Tax=Cryptolaemus montrouzieri TaxID=559131 RepID=A0ABD2NGI5_9CUCU
MLKIIECPVCFDYMVPPIYQCCGGHSICGECKSQVQQCPTCEKPFGETQNFAVESFTTFLTYPCKNSERGCDFLSPAKEIRHHEKLCIFGCYECPTSAYTHCKWFGLNQDIWQHCREQHADNVMENPVISLPFDMEEDLDTEDDDCFILKFRKNIFILHWEYREQSIFRWSLQLVGPTEESKNYSFDLDIIDRSGRNQRIYIKSLCESFTHKDLAFQDNKTFIYLTLDQVKPLLNEVFCFKISVYENQ